MSLDKYGFTACANLPFSKSMKINCHYKSLVYICSMYVCGSRFSICDHTYIICVWLWESTKSVNREAGLNTYPMEFWNPLYLHSKRATTAGHWWLMPIILAIQETEIRKISAQGQPWQIVHKTLSQKSPTQKRAGKVAQVVECRLSIHKALSSNPSTNK
jgi:hypothetical protein